MFTSKFREWMIFLIYRMRGQKIGQLFYRYQKEDREGIPPDTTRQCLIQLLQHCEQNVPYYQRIMKKHGDSYRDNPFEYIQQMPILTKDMMRAHFDELKSLDLSKRHWYVNTSGGSTGEPVEFIQDRYSDALKAPISELFSSLCGGGTGERTVKLWGSLHDLHEAEENWKAVLIGWLSNTTMKSVYHLEPEAIEAFVKSLNRRPPKLIVGYGHALNEIAKYIENTGLQIRKQNAIISSAGMLYPEFRTTIERVFQCKVYNRYGSRELGDIACERPGYSGMWVAPWGNYLEIVDEDGIPVPNGVEGKIVATSFCNYAMPFVRYQIEDRGVLAPPDGDRHPKVGQVLEKLTGRTMEVFYNFNGEIVDSAHFMPILYHLNWIRKYQVVQNNSSCITFRIVKSVEQPPENDIAQITHLTRGVMHDDSCQIDFEYVDDILPTASGKYKFLINEMKPS